MDGMLVAALLLAALGVLVLVLAARGRSSRGLGAGRTVALDDRTLYSDRLKLVGRPDRLAREGEWIVPEEWKSSKRAGDGHRLQLGTYLLLIEEEFGMRPPHGYVVLGDGSRVRIKNTEELRRRVLETADAIRRSRRALQEEIPVRQPAAKCRACGQGANCRQRQA